MNNRLGFFDVDCLELNADGIGLDFRPRVAPILSAVKTLHDLAEKSGSPLVFTTCCSGRMLGDEELPDILKVPLDVADAEWRTRVKGYRIFYLQKKSYGDPKKNYTCRAYDMFQDNGNAVLLFEMLGEREWVVFGNGFDLCVDSAANGLLKAGYRVRILTDVKIRSAKGYDDSGTDERYRRMLDDLGAMGAKLSSLDEFIESESA
ncbi:MAG TPA: hypothetical protein PL033_17540 [Candidatus Brocadiia bacterium]|nr:hypothetical protein [Candidatus Brocadiia bacterium]